MNPLGDAMQELIDAWNEMTTAVISDGPRTITVALERVRNESDRLRLMLSHAVSLGDGPTTEDAEALKNSPDDVATLDAAALGVDVVVDRVRQRWSVEGDLEVRDALVRIEGRAAASGLRNLYADRIETWKEHLEVARLVTLAWIDVYPSAKTPKGRLVQRAGRLHDRVLVAALNPHPEGGVPTKKTERAARELREISTRLVGTLSPASALGVKTKRFWDDTATVVLSRLELSYHAMLWREKASAATRALEGWKARPGPRTRSEFEAAQEAEACFQDAYAKAARLASKRRTPKNGGGK